jgi:hypothetical protein
MSLETILIIVLIVFLLGRRRLVVARLTPTFWNKIADRVINVELILAASSGVPNAIFVRD